MSELITAKQVKDFFQKRKGNTHKGDYGYVTLIGGCVKYSGAVRLAALGQSSLRTGAGVCTIAAPSSIKDAILPHILENTFFPLSDNEGDLVFKKTEIDELIEKSDLIAIGMGIGNTHETRKAVNYLLENYEGTLIVDADGINAMAKLGIDNVKHHKCKLIVTPHPKEFSRLSQINIRDVIEDPQKHVRELANTLNAIVLFKGHVSIVSDGSITYRVERGCPGMATAGSGDVLSGILSAMLATNKDRLLIATAAGAYLNGLAGELASKEKGEYSMLASDTAAQIENAIKLVTSETVPKWEYTDTVEQKEKPKKEVKAQPKEKKSFGQILLIILFVIILGFAGWYTLYEVEQERIAYEASIDHRELVEDYAMKLEFVYKDIYIDGVLVNNYQLYRPFGMANGHIYVPLSEEICSALGIKAEYIFTEEQEDIIITQDTASGEGVFYDVHAWNPYDINGYACGNVTIYLENGEESEKLLPEADECFSFNEGEVMYIPLNFLTESENIKLSAFYENMTGLYLSTDPEKPAEKYYNENNASYITGRSNYILSYQPQLGLGVCSKYEYLFRHEANTYDVDEDLLLAIARTESSFNINDLSEAGARGIMQIMPDTARSQGVDPEILFDLEASIEFGAYYLKNAFTNFKGDEIKALSCYNFGGNAVLSGAYDTGYASTVINRRDALKKWLSDQGYSNEFETVIECTK